MTEQPLVSHVSDTARWVAVHRATETKRPDALFADPFAARLAGPRGHEIAATAARSIADDWFLVSRTKLVDDRVTAAVAAGCDVVVNLGAGLDTRPYRMALPPGLRWIEADLPGLITEKTALLADADPRCRLVRTSLDITDAEALSTFLDDSLEGARQALVVTEGLVMYLSEENVIDLARTLRHPAVAGWCLDFSTAGVAALMADRNQGLLRHAPWTFLPANGLAFFEDLGWHAAYVESILTAAARFDRLSSPQMQAAATGPQPDPRRPGDWPYSAVTHLTRPA
ncbi:SAM-dependent methyltransferase [Nocardia sp. NPDC019395]|uniref:class I SAM-dependent methyltransferase n=1 Tax=Nocardia sp. NPDC019395 TaxID=3154686 RepID=UPI00340E6A24